MESSPDRGSCMPGRPGTEIQTTGRGSRSSTRHGRRHWCPEPEVNPAWILGSSGVVSAIRRAIRQTWESAVSAREGHEQEIGAANATANPARRTSGGPFCHGPSQRCAVRSWQRARLRRCTENHLATGRAPGCVRIVRRCLHRRGLHELGHRPGVHSRDERQRVQGLHQLATSDRDAARRGGVQLQVFRLRRRKRGSRHQHLSALGQGRASPLHTPARGGRSNRAFIRPILCPVTAAALPPAFLIADTAETLVRIGQRAAARGWVPATSGNFSVKDGESIYVTMSGRDKGSLTTDDVAAVHAGLPLPTGLSAEAPLHLARYAADPRIGAVFHIHSPAAVAISYQHRSQEELLLQGWELQKAFAGVRSHEQTIVVPIFPNSQQVSDLALAIESQLSRLTGRTFAPGYLIAGHGLYAWGASAEDAWRHLEAFDALFQTLLYFATSSAQP